MFGIYICVGVKVVGLGRGRSWMNGKVIVIEVLVGFLDCVVVEVVFRVLRLGG